MPSVGLANGWQQACNVIWRFIQRSIRVSEEGPLASDATIVIDETRGSLPEWNRRFTNGPCLAQSTGWSLDTGFASPNVYNLASYYDESLLYTNHVPPLYPIMSHGFWSTQVSKCRLAGSTEKLTSSWHGSKCFSGDHACVQRLAAATMLSICGQQQLGAKGAGV